MTTICDGCKFAEWRMTVAARRHPSGVGRCNWEKKIRIAASATRPGSYADRGEPFTVKGGAIWRKDGPTRCDMFLKKD